jgi:serine/threonine protein kinase/WD40 repeat protein
MTAALAMQTCPKCGAEKAEGALAGLCPKCLAALALATGPEPEPAPTPSLPLTEKPGDRIGHYKLLQQIGEGGCGIVYMAQQDQPVRRQVALKIIKLGMDTRNVIARFEAERQALALMDHPNIAKVFDAGATELGRPFFVMELVRGTKITAYCDENRLSTRERLDLFIQVCHAIEHAHQKGVIHRDIKPSNILVMLRDNVPVPKVIDFGIAKATTDQLLTDKTIFTQFQQFLGTPAYMSPEQAEMSELGVDTRSDIYSLGILLYELLTGRTPFETKDLLRAGVNEVVRIIREQEPARPSTRLSSMVASELTTTAHRRRTDPPKLISLVRGDLDWIVMKALEKDRTRRYETANGLAMDLRCHLKNEPVIARPPSKLYEFQKTVQRHKFGFAAGAAIILVLAAGVFVSTWQAVHLARAQRATTEKLFDAYLAQARARRRDDHEGRRFESMAVVAKAAAIHSSLELRNEAIACLALTDVQFPEPQAGHDPDDDAWSPNLALRALRQPGGSVSVRRTHDNAEVGVLPSPGAAVYAFRGFSLDGRYLLVSYVDRRSVLWDIEKREPALGIPGARSCDFSADGRTMAVHCADGQLRSFGFDPLRPLASVPANPRYWGIRLRPQDDWFAGYELDKGELEVCDLRDGSRLHKLVHPSRIGTFAWSTDGLQLAVGCDSGRIFMWNALTGEKETEFQAHDDSVTSLGFSHSGWLLGSSSWDGQFRLWDLAAERPLVTAAGWSYQLMFSANDRRIGHVLRADESGVLEVTPSSVLRWLHCKPSVQRGSYSTDISADGRIVAAAFVDGVHLWADRQPEEPFVLPFGLCFSVIFTPDGTNIITCGRTGAARWPMQRIPGAAVDELRVGPRQWIRQGDDFNFAALSRDGNWLAAANPSAGAVSVYEVRNPTNHFDLVSQPRTQSIAISPDRRWVAAGNFKGSGVKVWDFESRQVACTLSTPSSAAVAFSPDNRWLGVRAVSFELWETGSWKRKCTFPRSRSNVTSNFAFSPDSRTLAISDELGLVHLVAADSGELQANLEGPFRTIVSFLRFSADGSQLFALQWDQQVQVWDLRQLRVELGTLKLDWKAPPIPPAPAGPKPRPLHISLAATPSP